MEAPTSTDINFKLIFESVPGKFLVLKPDSPRFTIATASNAYLEATMKKREIIVGKAFFEVFPDDPDDLTTAGTSDRQSSLERVLATKSTDTMPARKYDTPLPESEGGGSEERYWSQVNSPVKNEDGKILYIIHRVEDVTKQIASEDRAIEKARIAEEALLQKSDFIKENQERINSILESLLRYTVMDFSKQIEISDKGDELDAISIGLNTLSEELEGNLKQIKASEERARIIVEGVKDYAIFMIDPKGNILTWNEGARNIKGYKKEEVIGKNISIFYTEEEKAEHLSEKHLKNASEKGRIEVEEIRVRKDGTQFWADVVFNALYDEKGDLTGFVKITRDITERIKAETQIKSVNEFLDTILENIPNMIFVKDAQDLRFVRFNKAGENMLGYSRNDLIGKNDRDFFPKEQADFFISKDKEVLSQKEIVDIPEEVVQTTKGERWLHTKKIPISDENGNPKYLLGISDDITEQKQKNDRIRELNVHLENNFHQLEAVNKELESFSYSVSHDLRAPLRAINGYATIIEEDYPSALDSEGKRLLKNIQYNAAKMGNLIDDLLSFSRLGRKEVQKTKINTGDLVDSVIAEIKKNIPNKARFTVSEMPDIQADYSLIHQVLYNLVSNAVKYSSKKENPQVSISSEKKENELVMIIKDNGAGFDMNYAHKLFGVFQRLHTTEEFEGTGVGLAIVQRIITKHGGKVWAEAEPDKGATFYFSLPLT